MIPNPIFRNPYKRNPTVWRKKNGILGIMRKKGMLSKGDYEDAINKKINLR
jgi:membrane peptidoglycan carboxypeptidase